MTTNSKNNLVGQITRRGLVVGALLAVVVCATDISCARAQSASTTSSAGTATSAQTATPNAVPQGATETPAPATESGDVANQPQRKGQQEGITVHGHWTIEVRNPDGKIATHREFENSLLDNANILSGLVGHTATAGGLSITLLGPCGTIIYSTDFYGNVTTGPGCVLYESDSQAFTAPFYQGFLQNATNYLGINDTGHGTDCSHGNGNCYGVLSVTNGRGADVLSLQGTFLLPSTSGSGNISTVYANLYTCDPSNSPTACTTGPYATSGNFHGSFALTGTTLASPVPISAGQTVSVGVQISFSSH